MSSTDKYARDRDKALSAFVYDGDFEHIDALVKRYGMRPIPHTDVGAAAVYKAVQECTNIPQEVKAKAFIKCVDLGFMPRIGDAGE